ncbi:hypothetical protein, partial [Salinibacterium sp.]|uniref:hypothetical protein n=1 Tax=Salinibacterium sp. TaxID=1915057 RepID=UPI00286B3C01
WDRRCGTATLLGCPLWFIEWQHTEGRYTSRMDDTTARATEHTDSDGASPPCPTCGSPRELVMLERFTGWWCRDCAEAGRPPAAQPL